MKKTLAILLALLLTLSLTACGGGNGGGENSGDVDMSKYPAEWSDWTGQNIIDYFDAAGVFKGVSGVESWTQGHEDWPGTPMRECVGWWDDLDIVSVFVYILDPDLPDSSQADYDEWMTCFRETKGFPEGYVPINIDHLVGNVAFEYQSRILDEETLERMDAAYENLVSTLGVTPEW